MEDYRTIGAIAALVAAAATPLLLMRWREATASGEPDEALRPPSESERSKSKKRKPKKASGGGGGAHSTEEEDEAALSAGLPVLTVGQRSWHKVREEFVTVTKVHFDDPPPYYTVRTISGVELHTVRTRSGSSDSKPRTCRPRTPSLGPCTEGSFSSSGSKSGLPPSESGARVDATWHWTFV